MSATGAAVKLAARTAGRNRKRTLLLCALIAIPVMVAAVAGAYFRASHVTMEEQALSEYGGATVKVELDGVVDGFTPWLLEAVGEIAPTADVGVHRTSWGTISAGRLVEMIDGDLDHPVTAGLLDLTEGRAPTSPGEIAITEYLASEEGAGIGDTIAIRLPNGIDREFLITGLLTHPVFWADNHAVVTPDALDAIEEEIPGGVSSAKILIAAPEDLVTAEGIRLRWHSDMHLFHPAGAPPLPEEFWLDEGTYFALDPEEVEELNRVWSERGESAAWEYVSERFWHGDREGAPVYLYVESRTERLSWSPDNPMENPPVVSSAVAAGLLAEVAFIAGAAFATGIRRRLREIGLIGANGADDSHVKAVVLGEGLLVGVIGGLSGVALALVLLAIARPTLQNLVPRRIEDFPLAPVDVAGPLLLAVAAAAIAAWLPAKTAAAVPILTALQGRVPASTPRRWVPVVGVVFTAFGTLFFATGLTAHTNEVTVIGVVMMIGGVAMLAGPLVAWLSRFADRFPITARTVLRDSGRHRTRAAGAVAATMVIMVLPVVGLAGGNSSIESELIHGLPSSRPQLLLKGAVDNVNSQAVPISPSNRETIQGALGEIARAIPVVRTADFLAAEVAVDYPAEWTAKRAGEPIDQMVWHEGRRVAIAEPDLLEVLDDARLEAALRVDGMALIGTSDRRVEIGVEDRAVEVAEIPLPVPYDFPRLLLTEDKAAELGVVADAVMGYAVSPKPHLEIFGSFWSPARDAFAGRFDSSTAAGNLMVVTMAVVVVATLVVVLLVVAIVTSLSATESDEELRTMVAVGAVNSIRRKYLGLQSWMHTTIAALLAVPLAILLVSTAVEVGYNYRAVGGFGVYDSSRLYVPWPAVVGLAIGLPVVVGLLTALFVRSAPTTPPRRAT